MSSENASVKTFTAATHAALAAVALTPKFMSNPDVNVGVMINSTPPELISAASASLCDRNQKWIQSNRPVISTTIDKETRCGVHSFSNTKNEIVLDAPSVNF